MRLILPFLLLFSLTVRGATLNVKNAPYNAVGNGGTDDTAAIQAAVNAAGSGDTVYVPNGTYLINPVANSGKYGVYLKNNLTFQMASGATLQAITNCNPCYAILAVYRYTNVVITGGSISGERWGHQALTNIYVDCDFNATVDASFDQWGFGIEINSSRSVVVDGVTITDCWGDGIYVSESGAGSPSYDVTVKNVIANRNRRNGISIISANLGMITNCTLISTWGSPPQAGIDFEPNPGQSINDYSMLNCVCSNNAFQGILAGGGLGVSNLVIQGNTVVSNGWDSAHYINTTTHQDAPPPVGTWQFPKALKIDNATNCNISTNLFIGNFGSGPQILYCSNVTFQANIVGANLLPLGSSVGATDEPGVGIVLEHDTGCVVNYNTITNNAGQAIFNYAQGTPNNNTNNNTHSGNSTGVTQNPSDYRYVYPFTTPTGDLVYLPAPLLNPLRGSVPYVSFSSELKARFPYTMTMSYVSVSNIVTALDTYNWTPLDNIISYGSSNGAQVIVRFCLDYPNDSSKGGTPSYLISGGLTMTAYSGGQSPDWENLNLRHCMTGLVAAAAARYDGDSRVAFWEIGLLGHYGEWWESTPPWASKTVQGEVLWSFTNAFHTTKALIGNFSGLNPVYASTYVNPSLYGIGYHDDSFCWSTLSTDTGTYPYYSYVALVAGAATNKWKTEPIGGELRPELWPSIWTNAQGVPYTDPYQAFTNCYPLLHTSWLMDSGCFGDYPAGTNATWNGYAQAQYGRLGYEFYIPWVSITGSTVSTVWTNTGVAPFYYSWVPKIYAIQGATTNITTTAWDIRSVISGDGYVTNSVAITAPTGVSTLYLKIQNPLTNGFPVVFANAACDTNGMMLLGSFTNSTPPTPIASQFNATVLNVGTIKTYP